MEVIRHLTPLKNSPPCVVTIGMFDGVHIGHQKILEKLKLTSKEKKLQSVVFTFSPHPRQVLEKDSHLKLILTDREKINILKKKLVDKVVIQPFTKDFAQNSAENFIKNFLVEPLNMKHLIVGYDHRLGKDQQAHFSDLKTLGKKYNFEVEQIKAQKIDDISISSTKIRNALINKNLHTANSFMNHAFPISGTVIHGKKIGRTIGFPTANIAVENQYKLIPPKGVYGVCCFIDETLFWGLLNIGKNPTIESKGDSIEVHLFDFKGNLYGKKLTLYLLEYLRDELKFDNLNSLKHQIELDKTIYKQNIEQNHNLYLSLI